MKIMRRKLKGLTLVEVLVATLVVTIGLASLLSSLTSMLYLIQDSKSQTIANADLRSIIEEMKSTPFDSMSNVFPNAVVDGPAIHRYNTITGSYTLSNEHIIVTYPNVSADPLEILVTLTWQDMMGRARNLTMSTFKTR
jgi:Tfp pilus assembly protein PilV